MSPERAKQNIRKYYVGVMTNGQERTPMTHALQILPAEFSAITDGKKRFVYLPDRGFVVGDLLRLMEWDPLFDAYTGSWSIASVLYSEQGGNVPLGHTILSISPLIVSWRDDQRLMRTEDKPGHLSR